MAANQTEFLSSFFSILENWSTLVRLCFSHLWDRVHALVQGDSKASALCVIFGRWRASPPKKEVIAEIIDMIDRTKDPDLIEGLGLLIQKACLDPGVLVRMEHIAHCARRTDRLDSGPVLYALRAKGESDDLLAGVMHPNEITCSPIDLLKHVRIELLSCDGITHRILSVMMELERAALENIDRDQKLTSEQKRHLREGVLIANAIAYTSWADRQVSEGGVQGCLNWCVN